jgi:hypothetical protein
LRGAQPGSLTRNRDEHVHVLISDGCQAWYPDTCHGRALDGHRREAEEAPLSLVVNRYGVRELLQQKRHAARPLSSPVRLPVGPMELTGHLRAQRERARNLLRDAFTKDPAYVGGD